MVEFVINIDEELTKALADLKMPSNALYSKDFMFELNKTITESTIAGDPLDVMNKKISSVYDGYEQTFKSKSYSTLSSDSGVKWGDIKGLDAYEGGISLNAQVNKSWQVGKNVMRGSAVKNRARFNNAIKYLNADNVGTLKRMGITGDTEEELLRAIIDDFTSKLNVSLGGNAKNRSTSLRQSTKTRVRYEKSKSIKCEVVYMLGETEKHCSVCSPRDGKVYKNINIAPSLPEHTKCACFYVAKN